MWTQIQTTPQCVRTWTCLSWLLKKWNRPKRTLPAGIPTSASSVMPISIATQNSKLMINSNLRKNNKTRTISSSNRMSRCGCVSFVMSPTYSILKRKKSPKRRILCTWWKVSLKNRMSLKRIRPWFSVLMCRAAWTPPPKSKERLI